MPKKFIKAFNVHYYEINKYSEATPVTILNYLEETAIAHSDAVGLGYQKLMSMGLAWVLNQWLVEFERFPHWNEQVIVETWPSDFHRFFATREFLMRDDKNNIICRASSRWILLNLEKKRPIRVPADYADLYGFDTERAINGDFEDIPEIANMVDEKEFFVRREDIDTNNHVNNTRYVSWILESVPKVIYDDYRLAELKVLYKKEAGSDSLISSACQQYGSSANEYLHSVYDQKHSQLLTTGFTKWKARA